MRVFYRTCAEATPNSSSPRPSIHPWCRSINVDRLLKLRLVTSLLHWLLTLIYTYYYYGKINVGIYLMYTYL